MCVLYQIDLYQIPYPEAIKITEKDSVTRE